MRGKWKSLALVVVVSAAASACVADPSTVVGGDPPQAATSLASGPSEGRDANGSSGSPAQLEPEDEPEFDSDTDSETAPDTDSEPEGTRCRANGYELSVPTGWFHFDCAYFNVDPVTRNPATCDCQFPIDIAVARNESFIDAMDRISTSGTWTIRSEDRRSVDGHDAILLDTVVEQDGQRLERRIYLIDLEGNGTLFLAGTNKAGEAPDDLLYDAVLAGLDELIGSLVL